MCMYKSDLCVCTVVVLHARMGTDITDTNAFIESAYWFSSLLDSRLILVKLAKMGKIKEYSYCIYSFVHSHSHFSSSK